jgi:hypothetical protein
MFIGALWMARLRPRKAPAKKESLNYVVDQQNLVCRSTGVTGARPAVHYFAVPQSSRSITASISAPPRMTIDEIQIHVMKPMAAPKEP